MAFDTDVEQARRARHAIMAELAELAESQELVGGHHLDFPGIGYVVANGNGYCFLPHVWQPTL